MFLRQNKRRKNGKTHRYFTVVENRRVSGGGTTQRQVLYLGEINDTQQQAWRRTLEVFDEDHHQYRELSLFPDDPVAWRVSQLHDPKPWVVQASDCNNGNRSAADQTGCLPRGPVANLAINGRVRR